MDTVRCRIGWISRRNVPSKHCCKNNVNKNQHATYYIMLTMWQLPAALSFMGVPTHHACFSVSYKGAFHWLLFQLASHHHRGSDSYENQTSL